MNPSVEYRIGDVFARLAEIPDGSIDLVLTSPPFLALRSYLPADHPDKQFEIGSEPDPATFIDTLLRLAVEWRRVLAPHGSICIELGDTYSGSGGAGGDYNADGLRGGQAKFDGSNHRRGKVVDHDSGRRNPGPGWPLPKSLCGIPWLYSLSLAYGRNLLNHEHTIEPWRVRNVVAWCRPNPPVGALGDKFRPATSYMTIACVGQKRYFDLDAVREPAATGDRVKKQTTPTFHPKSGRGPSDMQARLQANNPAGVPPLDYWEIPTQPYKGSHYATWPEALIERPIKAMCPAKVCTVCGKPSERIVDSERTPGPKPDKHKGPDAPGIINTSGYFSSGGATTVVTTLGWSDCGHNAWRTGVVLDPFGGSGTTLAVAQGLGRSAIGIDLDARNADLARERVGMFLEVQA